MKKRKMGAEDFESIPVEQRLLHLEKLMAEACRKRLRQRTPKLDEKTVNQIVEEMEAMPQRIRAEYWRRDQEMRSQPLDEAMMNDLWSAPPMPPMSLVENALAERMHLPADVRMQQVATLMVEKYLHPGPMTEVRQVPVARWIPKTSSDLS
jgi:hypothetical protein